MQKNAKKNPETSELPIKSGISGYEFRKESFKLLREATRDLGWKYRLWIPVSVLLASVFLLPPRLFQFFTENITRISDIDGESFLRQLVVFGLLIAACLWIGIFLGGVLAEWLRLVISVNLRKAALGSMLESKLEKIDDAERGDWMTRMTGDLSSCEDFLSDSIPEQIRNLTIMIGAAVLFAVYSGWVALVPIGAAVLLGWFNLFAQKKMAPVLGQSREIEGGIFQTIIESFEGIRTIRSFGGETSVRENLSDQLANLKRVGMRIIRIMAGLMGLNEMASQIVVTIILTIVAYRITGDDLTVADALFYPFYLTLFLNSAKGLVAAAYDWNRFFVEGGRLASLLYDDSGKVDSEFEVKGVVGVTALWGKGIEIRYGDDPPVVRDFDFHIERGDLLVLMGPSGCGKSTILEVMAGLRDHSGGELFLSTESESRDQVPIIPKSICAFVEQQPYLFVGTIRDNICLGQPSLYDVEVMSVVKAVGLEEVVNERGGLDAVLRDRGRNWSVGQQYRLALCRALVSNRPFLMLDEPFAALDTESVVEVVRTFALAKRMGAGIVLVTHSIPDELEPDKVTTLGS